MYCGETVPEGLQLSEEEASAILAAKHDKWKEDSKKRLCGRPTPPERDGKTFEEEWGWGEYFESGGGDSGGDEGGGD